ncbi:MAG: toxin-antitoxin system YwqK family antitoxin [Bacteroidales bacterium]|nr:toxin-antitoxin system YwqK family antitoxin [Bacteroidales bacterium]
MKKFLKTLLFLIIIGAGGFWVYIKYISPVVIKKAMTMIPEDAVMIIETNNLTEAWTEISDSKMWNYLISNPYFNDLNEDIELLNEYLKDNIIADKALKNRKLIMSLHMISATEWDFLFVVDLKNIAQIKKLGLKRILGLVEGYKVKERKFNDETIIELSDNEDPSDIIYLTISDNLLVATFTGSLIEKSISQKPTKEGDFGYWSNNKAFNNVVGKLYGEELFRMYFNYNQINAFSMSYLSEQSETVQMLGNSLTYSGFNINFRDESLSFEGYTDIDSVGSYVKAMANVTPGKLNAWRIMSNQTALYFSMGFNNFFDFYNNLTEQYKESAPEDMEDIENSISKIERLLKISMHDDFFSWIGNEIALVKLRPGKKTRLEDVVVAVHTNDIDDAKAGMDRIMQQIKKRVRVVKFKPEEYKNYTIQYLEMKGFFKIFLGRMFKDLEKPFFTYIEDYVIFSNSSDVIKNTIDDYLKGNTLDKNSGFSDFKDEFSNNSNIAVFIRTPQIYENLYYYSNEKDRRDIKENKEFILSFEKIGFQLVSEENMFKTTLIAQHNPDAIKVEELEKLEQEVYEEMFRDEVESLSFKISLADSFLEEDTLFKEYYFGGEKLKFEGRVYNKNLNGNWKTYYESGNIQSSVNYEDGIIFGEAVFYYDTEKNTKKAEAIFENDKLIEKYFEYYENGAQKAEIYYDDGLADGNAEFYYSNGKLKIKAEYKNGLKHGKWIYYDEKGKEIGKEKWKKGEKIR